LEKTLLKLLKARETSMVLIHLVADRCQAAQAECLLAATEECLQNIKPKKVAIIPLLS
jgi:hypothetical protein